MQAINDHQSSRTLRVCLASLLGASVAFAALPSGYTELQYIQGTGNAGAYICASDIYINPQTDKIETTFEVGSLSSGNGCAIWCARETYEAKTYSLLWSVNNKYNKLLFQAAYSNSDGTYGGRDTDPAVTNTIVTVTAEGKSWHVVTENGVNIQRGWPSSINASFTQTGGPLHLFAMANGTTIADGYYSAHKLYSFKIYTRSGDDYTLSHDLVPARRKSDGHVGLYDAAAGKFYANSGNGEFIAGPELNEEFSMSPLPDAVEVSSFAELLAGVEPAVIVSNLTTSTELERGKDYTVSYLNNSLIGTASVVVTGLGEYASNTSSATFKVRFAGQGDITTYYAIDGNMDGDMQSSISGTDSAIGWAAERGSATKAINGITDANGLYVVWTNNFMRTPQGSGHAAPETSVIVVEPNCTWNILNVPVASTTLGLNNVIVREGAMVKVEQYERSNYRPAGDEVVACGIDGSYDLADGACLRISTDFFSTDFFNPDGSVYDNANLFIRGGDIDGNGLASCLAIANSHHFTLADVTLHNGVRSGLCVTRETGGHLYELVANNVYCKCTMSGLAGNIGIDCQTADCHFTDCIVVDYTKGIRSSGGANRFTRCHVWGGTVPPKGMGFKEWSDAYARRKRLESARKWTAEDERAHLALGVPEMLPGSVAFECIGDSNVFDGCYADTAEIGYDIHRGAIIVNSGFYNNPRMNLRKSTAIVHRGGDLRVAFCDFRGGSGCEKLYEGDGRRVEWIGSRASGGAGMAADAARMFQQP